VVPGLNSDRVANRPAACPSIAVSTEEAKEQVITGLWWGNMNSFPDRGSPDGSRTRNLHLERVTS
jgi:hypothetical protein